MSEGTIHYLKLIEKLQAENEKLKDMLINEQGVCADCVYAKLNGATICGDCYSKGE